MNQSIGYVDRDNWIIQYVTIFCSPQTPPPPQFNVSCKRKIKGAPQLLLFLSQFHNPTRVLAILTNYEEFTYLHALMMFSY